MNLKDSLSQLLEKLIPCPCFKLCNTAMPSSTILHDGGDALGRLLLIYPWTQRSSSYFGNLSSAAAIARNTKVQAHGKRVLGALDKASHNLDNIKATFHDFSSTHANQLHMDPENFRRFGEVFVIVLAGKLGSSFTPSVQNAIQKFFAVSVDAFIQGYH
ncbi:hemoglobin subunit beta-3-like [Pelobates fuscus]|uniref:hemoglobin subunit beta-3-like n=1 Tax=Pelobates fuscus TaxID=191477 RepID=UPI002FE4DD1C